MGASDQDHIHVLDQNIFYFPQFTLVICSFSLLTENSYSTIFRDYLFKKITMGQRFI